MALWYVSARQLDLSSIGMDSTSTSQRPAKGSAIPIAATQILLPLLAASLIIWLEPLIGQLAQDRPGIVPVVVLSLIVGLVLPDSRRWLLVTLCFGVALMAVRDAIRTLHFPNDLPVGLREPIHVQFYALAWIILGGLAACAAVVEALKPGNIWAKRCYVLAAALYFIGHGVLNYIRQPNFHSILLVLIGVLSLLGAWLAERSAEEEPEEEILEEDLRAIAVRSNEKTAAVVRREWVEKS